MFAILAVIAAPGGIAFLLDRELSSPVHLPVMGIAGLCISLCDALCGQIISNTKWIPFSACHTPAEAQELVGLFKTYHRSMIVEWLIAKVTSAVVVMMTAAERSIDTIIYSLMPALPENRGVVSSPFDFRRRFLVRYTMSSLGVLCP